jgi:hypothetical protein
MNASMSGEPHQPGDAGDVAATRVQEYYASMDKRLSVLEMRFDTVLPTLATKADLAEMRTEILVAQERLRSDMTAAIAGLRVEMANLQRKLIMWIISTMVAMFLGMVGLFVNISSTMLETTERMVQAQMQAIHAAKAVPPSPSPSP